MSTIGPDLTGVDRVIWKVSRPNYGSQALVFSPCRVDKETAARYVVRPWNTWNNSWGGTRHINKNGMEDGWEHFFLAKAAAFRYFLAGLDQQVSARQVALDEIEITIAKMRANTERRLNDAIKERDAFLAANTEWAEGDDQQ